MNENTRKILQDLKNAGLDTSSLERQIAVDPIADKQADVHLGAGILRQADYTRYMNDVQIKEKELTQQVNQLAALHDVRDSGVKLPQESLDAIKAMEDALIATGEFEESSIRTLSNKAIAGFQKVNKPPQTQLQQQQQLQQPNTDLNNNRQHNIDMSKYVDVETMRQAMGNLAYGDIATTMEINAMLDEARGLGVKVDRAAVRKLQENLKKNFEGKGTLDDAFEATFELSKIRETKSQEEIENRIRTETDKRVAEELKAAGVPTTKKFNFGRRHPILDRKRETPTNIQTPENNTKVGEGDTKIPPPVDNGINKVPINKFGDVEVFRSRRGREDRLSAASGVLNEVMEHYSNDPTYVE